MPPIEPPRRALAIAFDAVAEATIGPSFSRVGIVARRRLERWGAPGSMVGKTVVVTGGTSGIGLAAAQAMAALGGAIHIVGRSTRKLDEAAASLRAASPLPVGVHQADLGDPAAAARLGRQLLDRCEQIDVLIHNAGALTRGYSVGPNGHELTVSTHVLAPYVLTLEVLPLLRQAETSRIVTVSSGGMYGQRFDLAALEMSPDDYRGVVSYARAKRAQVVLTQEWNRRLSSHGVNAYVMHPGWVDTPGLQSGLPHFYSFLRPLLRTPAEGADTIVWLAARDPAAPISPDQPSIWFDRHPRRTSRAVTHRSDDALGGPALWHWCSEQTSVDLAD